MIHSAFYFLVVLQSNDLGNGVWGASLPKRRYNA